MFGHPALRTSCIRAPRFGIGAPRFGRFCRTNIGHGNFTPLFCDLMVHFHLPAVAESLNYGFSVREVFHGIAALQPTFPNAKIMAALVPYLMYQRPTHTLLGLSWNCMCSCQIRGFTCINPKWYSYQWHSAFADIPQHLACSSSSSSSFPRRQSSIKDAEDPVEISSEDGDGDDDQEADPVRRASPRKGALPEGLDGGVKKCGQPCRFDD